MQAKFGRNCPNVVEFGPCLGLIGHTLVGPSNLKRMLEQNEKLSPRSTQPFLEVPH